jgi:hypothetical protein
VSRRVSDSKRNRSCLSRGDVARLDEIPRFERCRSAIQKVSCMSIGRA